MLYTIEDGSQRGRELAIVRFVRALTLPALLLAGSVAHAQETNLLKCTKAQVQSLRLEIQTGKGISPEKLAEVTVLDLSEESGSERTVSLLGPVLGTMDSERILLDVSCVPSGVLVTAMVTRSADYHGSVQKYATWRPLVKMTLVHLKSDLTVTAIWKMRLTDNREVKHAQTPPYPALDYPVVVSRKIR